MRSSSRTDSAERDWMIRPWCAVIEQNVQPPKQPRINVTESLTTSNAGIFSALVHRVRLARVGQAVDPVHVVLADRQWRRIADDGLAVVELNQRAGVERVGLLVDDLRRRGELPLVGLHLLEGGQARSRQRESIATRWRPRRRRHPRMSRRSLTVSPAASRRAIVDDLVLAHAEDDEVGLGVEHDRPADRVAPVVVMRQPAQRGLDAAGDDRHAGKRLAGALAVRDRGAVGPQADPAAGRIGVVVADLLVGRVMVDHAVHVAGADAEEQPGPAELPPRLGTPPVGLAEDRDAEPGRLEHPAQDPHANAG